MLNKTDFKILEFCSLKYQRLSASEISKGLKLHITTVSGRLENLFKREYLTREKSGKGFAYKFNFAAEHARKFRLFLDMESAYSLSIEKLKEFIVENRNDQNILCCFLYGSAAKTKEFNDIDLLIVYNESPIRIKDQTFDLFQMDVKSFRNLYSIGEPRLQSALLAGRILVDRDFIFNYLENLPIKASEDVLAEIRKKHDSGIKSIEAMKKPEKEELRKMLLDALQLKAVMEFASQRLPVPAKPDFKKELSVINPELGRLMEKISSAKTAKELLEIFYSEIL